MAAGLAVEAAPNSSSDAHDLIVALISDHGPALLATARRFSLCADDAYDAYQRAMEILIRRVDTLERATLANWTHTVVKHEAMALRASRQRLVAAEDPDLDSHVAERVRSTDEHVATFDRMSRSAEALGRLKPQELRALWLKAQGHSYAEIAESTGWSATKVNRCITEGRRAFLVRYAGIESGEECRRWAPVISAMVDGEAGEADIASVRPHLRHCPGCRATLRELRLAGPRLGGVLPVAGLVTGGATSASHGPLALIVRLYEAVVGGAQERVFGSALKLQAAAETVSVGKVAAVAASALSTGKTM